MSLPVKERIALEIASRLAAITKANGYSDKVTVVRPTRVGGFTPENRLIVIHQDDPEENPEASVEGNPPVVGYDVPFLLELYVRPSDKSSEAIDTLINLFEAEVVQALTDAEDWHTFGNVAIAAEFMAPKGFVVKDGSHEGIYLPLIVTYRHPENDLTEAVL